MKILRGKSVTKHFDCENVQNIQSILNLLGPGPNPELGQDSLEIIFKHITCSYRFIYVPLLKHPGVLLKQFVCY